MAQTALIVESNIKEQQLISILLRDLCECIIVNNTNEAKEWLTQTKELPTIILSDLELPIHKGQELLRWVSKTSRFKHVPFVYITQQHQDTVEDAMLELGATDFIRKPYTAMGIRCRIKTHLDLSYNIEQLKLTQEQLLQSEKMAAIGQLAAGVAHEINNPIGFVITNFNSLRRYSNTLTNTLSTIKSFDNTPEFYEQVHKALSSDEMEYIIEDICEAIEESGEGLDRVKKIVADLKTFSHAGEGEFETVDIRRCIQSTLNLAKNETKYKAEVVTHFEDIPQIECIPSQLNQVFLNMIINSCQAIEEKGRIWISTYSKGDHHITIEFRDNGPGIPENIIKNIFNPFFTTKPVGQGTGLGLSLSYNIISQHNGNIDVSSHTGKGTKFTIQLPIHQSEKPAPQTDSGNLSDTSDGEDFEDDAKSA